MRIMMKTFKIILISFIVFFVCSKSPQADIFDRYLSLRIAVNCNEWLSEPYLYAVEAQESKLEQWFANDPCTTEGHQSGEFKEGIVAYDEPISLQSACAILSVDPVATTIVYNALIEMTTDPDFEGKACTLAWVFH